MAVFIVFAVFLVALLILRASGYGGARAVQLQQARRYANLHISKAAVFALSVPVDTRLNFALQADGDQTRALRAQGSLTERKTGDRAFDARVFLECDDPTLAKWLATSEPARTLVLQLIDAPGRVELSGRRLRLILGGNDMSQLVQLAQALAELGQLVPRVQQLNPNAASLAGRIALLRLSGGALLTLALAAGLHLLYEISDASYPQHAGLLGVLPLLLLAAVFGYGLGRLLHRMCRYLLRNSSWAPRIAAELVLTIWLPVIALSMLGARYANLHLAHSAQQQSVARVDQLYSERGRHLTRFYVVLGHIDDAGIEARPWPSSEALNHALQRVTRVRVYWRSGWLGSVIITRPPEPIAAES
jgi:hypothetical protein